MAFLTEDPNVPWVNQIPEISTDDPVLGGPGGAANNPHDALAKRTQYLKRLLEEVEAEILGMGDVQAHFNSATVHQATSEAIANRIVKRDGAGRFQVAAPAAPEDAANKSFVETAVSGAGGGGGGLSENDVNGLIDDAINDATTAVKGIVQLATNAETSTGTNATKAVTPAGMASAITTVIVNAAAI